MSEPAQTPRFPTSALLSIGIGCFVWLLTWLLVAASTGRWEQAVTNRMQLLAILGALSALGTGFGLRAVRIDRRSVLAWAAFGLNSAQVAYVVFRNTRPFYSPYWFA